ncbi:hypothetical protein B7C42_02770 [Nocardia cerradoensis]|uniref:Uncharacterized protein n=1 Tax=Nocardia cerradoensis TaxID=85688 RepID=A0A231H7W4_9NOCA|nr:hypothetical protein B7C42_02770 [Nocardia cerradoensis]
MPWHENELSSVGISLVGPQLYRIASVTVDPDRCLGHEYRAPRTRRCKEN